MASPRKKVTQEQAVSAESPIIVDVKKKKDLERTLERTPEQLKCALRASTKFFYDIQLLRMQTDARTKRMCDEGKIQLLAEDLQALSFRANELKTAEHDALKLVKKFLRAHPFYRFLADTETYKGIGPAMAAVILSEFDPYKAKYVSCFWSYAGIAPKVCYRCASCHQEVMPVDGKGIVKEGLAFHHKSDVYSKKCVNFNRAFLEELKGEAYVSGKPDKPTKGEKLAYNDFVKTKLLGVLAPVMIKLSSPFRKFYDDFKLRWVTAGRGNNPAHVHKAAMRHMIKMLLKQIWLDWRRLEGLEIVPDYHEQKQGGHGWKEGMPPAEPFETIGLISKVKQYLEVKNNKNVVLLADSEDQESAILEAELEAENALDHCDLE